MHHLLTGSILTDHAVIQQGVAIPLSGTAAPGAKVTVDFLGQRPAATTDRRGHWHIQLGPFETGLYGDLVVSSTDGARTVARDVAVGEVWVCSGQSNMEFALKDAEDAPAMIAGTLWMFQS